MPSPSFEGIIDGGTSIVKTIYAVRFKKNHEGHEVHEGERKKKIKAR
jgi:hypothetical protein